MADIRAGQRIRIYRASDDKDLGLVLADPFFQAQSDGIAVVTTAVRDVAAGAADGGITVMAQRHDAGGALVGATGDNTPLQTDSTGRLRVVVSGGGSGNTSVRVDDTLFTVATDEVTPMGAMYDDTTPPVVSAERDVGIPRMTADRKLLVRVVGAADGERLDINGAGQAQVDLAAVSVTAVPISKDATANAAANPIFVQAVTSVVTGTGVHDHDEAVDLAKDGTNNHDLAVTAASTLAVRSVLCSASGSAKYTIQFGPTAGFVTRAVVFTGPGQLSVQVEFDPPLELTFAVDETVRVIRRNDDNTAQSVYTTIMGDEF